MAERGVVGMKRCQPCNLKWLTWSRFVRHLTEVHHENRAAVWRRANQVGDAPCFYLISEGGDGFLLAQGGLL